MNRLRARELLPIIEAFANGETVQQKDRRECDEHPSYWEDIINIAFFIDNLKPCEFEYRIKPKPREFWIDLRTNDAFCNEEYAVMNDLAGRSKIVHVREVL